MTNEELLARIAELEEKVAVLENQKIPQHTVSEEMIKKFPWLDKHKFRANYNDFVMPVGKVIRIMCFPHDRYNNIRPIKLNDMSKEQYEKYCACMESVAKAFEPYLDSRFTSA